jgi:hypothetical protein
MYILDTNIISAARLPGRNSAVATWLREIPASELYTTAINLAEIEQGVRTKERGDPEQGSVLRRWFNTQVLPAFVSTNRVLPFDVRAARTFGHYPVPEEAPKEDALVAAIAESNGMIVATRNTKHFVPLGVRTINPWLHEHLP